MLLNLHIEQSVPAPAIYPAATAVSNRAATCGHIAASVSYRNGTAFTR